MSEKLRMMVVNDEATTIMYALNYLSCLNPNFKFKKASNAQEAVELNPLEYNVALIDASNDCEVRINCCLSEYLKSQNPNMIIIGTSCGGAYFEKDGLSKQMYDERINIPAPTHLGEEIKRILEEYGFEFPEVIEK